MVTSEFLKGQAHNINLLGFEMNGHLIGNFESLRFMPELEGQAPVTRHGTSDVGAIISPESTRLTAPSIGDGTAMTSARRISPDTQ